METLINCIAAGIMILTSLAFITMPFWVFALALWANKRGIDREPAETKPSGGER